MFEQAARLKLRFDTCIGRLSAEDLWDLPLVSARGANLNDIAIDLHHRVQNEDVSFVEEAQKPDARLQLAFDIVKHVIDVKKAERKTAQEVHAKAERKRKLLDILARKEDAALEGASEDDIRRMIEELAA